MSRASSAAETLLVDAARCRAGGVDLVTHYVRGVPRETNAHLLGGLVADLVGLPRQMVVDVDRCGDVAAITLLADAGPSFSAALRTLSAAAVLTPLADADPASASFFGARHRRGLSLAAADAAARDFFARRLAPKLQQLVRRTGMPPWLREAFRRHLAAQLAPLAASLWEGGGEPAPAPPDAVVAGSRRRREPSQVGPPQSAGTADAAAAAAADEPAAAAAAPGREAADGSGGGRSNRRRRRRKDVQKPNHTVSSPSVNGQTAAAAAWPVKLGGGNPRAVGTPATERRWADPVRHRQWA